MQELSAGRGEVMLAVDDEAFERRMIRRLGELIRERGRRKQERRRRLEAYLRRRRCG